MNPVKPSTKQIVEQSRTIFRKNRRLILIPIFSALLSLLVMGSTLSLPFAAGGHVSEVFTNILSGEVPGPDLMESEKVSPGPSVSEGSPGIVILVSQIFIMILGMFFSGLIVFFTSEVVHGRASKLLNAFKPICRNFLPIVLWAILVLSLPLIPTLLGLSVQEGGARGVVGALFNFGSWLLAVLIGLFFLQPVVLNQASFGEAFALSWKTLRAAWKQAIVGVSMLWAWLLVTVILTVFLAPLIMIGVGGFASMSPLVVTITWVIAGSLGVLFLYCNFAICTIYSIFITLLYMNVHSDDRETQSLSA